MKILVVDDDTQLTQLIQGRLLQEQYTVDISLSGEDALDLVRANPYGLILLDLALPQIGGIEVCQALRRQGDCTPILMLTGQDRTQDKVTALDAGADDYLVKPFALDELMARVRALLRRDADQNSPLFCYGPLQFNPSSQELTYQGQCLLVRPKERAILELMLRYPTQIFAPETLLEKLWTLAECPGKATIKSHIRSLRKQLALVGADAVIETLYGQGYRLNPALLDEPVATPPSTEPRTLGSPPAFTDAMLIHQTWEQVQGISWQRLVRLRQLVEPQWLGGDVLVTPLSQADQDRAIAIAHQLKGTLGSFGFTAASVQAQHLETQLAALTPDVLPELDQLNKQVQMLEQLLQQQMTRPPEALVDRVAQVLVITRDSQWGAQLESAAVRSSFQVQVCSPLTIHTFLLQQTPQVIVLVLDASDADIELNLLDVLHHNYGEQVPVIGVCDPLSGEIHRHVLERGGIAIALKTWSAPTVLAIVGEYLPTQHTAALIPPH